MSRHRPRVLHAVTSSLSLTLMRGQLQYLRRGGFEVTVLCSPGKEAEELQGEGVDVITVPMRREIAPFRDFVSLVRLVRVLRQLKPDIVNAGTPKAGLMVGIAAWLTRVPHRIFTLRGLRSETMRGWKRHLLRWAERLSCRVAVQVICVSPSLRERVLQLRSAPPEKVLVLRSGSSNGVDPSRFEPTPQRLRAAGELQQRLAIADGAPVLGFVGRFTRDKGIVELAEAARQLRQPWAELVLLLVGAEEPGDPPPQQAREVLRSPGVVVTGWVADASLYYHLMDVLVLPTHREGFPNTVLEAQAAGRPVVTTRATGAVDSIVDGVTGLLVPVGDAAALAEAVQKLLAEPALARSMGEAGRERIMREFRSELLCEALADMYRGMLRSGARTGSAAQTVAGGR